ncbi:MAG: AIR synthase-related protein, partial [Fusobacteriaceae bacterium]
VTPSAMCHITGGGFYENVPRILPEGMKAKFNISTIETPEIFNLLMEKGEVPKEEMYNVFNMGIGFMIVVPKEKLDKTIAILKLKDEKVKVIGEIVKGEGVELVW